MSQILLAVGVIAYVAGFFLVAVDGFEAHQGYICAAMALWVPLAALGAGHQDMSTSIFPIWTFGYPALFISGLINIAFPVALFLRLTGVDSGFQRLKAAIPLMIPCSWLVFVLLRFLPREGHLVWILGILIALFADEIAVLERRRRSKAIAGV